MLLLGTGVSDVSAAHPVAATTARISTDLGREKGNDHHDKVRTQSQPVGSFQERDRKVLRLLHSADRHVLQPLGNCRQLQIELYQLIFTAGNGH